jgi:hypothetical protein
MKQTVLLLSKLTQDFFILQGETGTMLELNMAVNCTILTIEVNSPTTVLSCRAFQPRMGGLDFVLLGAIHKFVIDQIKIPRFEPKPQKFSF